MKFEVDFTISPKIGRVIKAFLNAIARTEEHLSAIAQLQYESNYIKLKFEGMPDPLKFPPLVGIEPSIKINDLPLDQVLEKLEYIMNTTEHLLRIDLRWTRIDGLHTTAWLKIWDDDSALSVQATKTVSAEFKFGVNLIDTSRAIIELICAMMTIEKYPAENIHIKYNRDSLYLKFQGFKNPLNIPLLKKGKPSLIVEGIISYDVTSIFERIIENRPSEPFVGQMWWIRDDTSGLKIWYEDLG